ncbi:MAG: SUMF1/EgtB/PvdO family nonheme iron enzyme, partial [Planctomycetota bacterium]
MKSSAIIRLAANFGVSLILLLIFACAESRAQKPLPVRFPFLMEEKFDGDPKWWQDDNEYDWEINSNDGSRYLQLNDEPVRQGLDRPENVCWLKGLNLLDFDIRFRIKCRPVGREERGICVCWGRSFYESQRRNFYFAKLCESSGSCGIRVTAKNKIRSIASEKPTKGVPWTDGWHQVRVWRRVKDGQIRVYFDDMVKPILTARDETYDRGYFGVGSFGNHLSIDDVEFCGRLIRGGDRNDGALPRLKSYEARLYDWAKPGDMTPRIQTRQGIKFCRVPGGTFIKGRKSKRVPSIYDHKILHEKQHLVELSEFWVSACEITQSDYEKVMGTNPSFCRPLKGHDWRKGEDLSQHPVQNVNWFDAIQFCNRLSEKEGRQPCYVIKDIIRHPLPGSSLYEPGITQWVHSAHVSYSKEANGYRL